MGRVDVTFIFLCTPLGTWVWQITSQSFRDDGFFETGDTVTRENGYYKILGRTYTMDAISHQPVKVQESLCQ